MDTIQVILFFLTSFLLSRVFVKLKIPELILHYLFEKKHISIQKLTFILIMGTTVLSAIIANVITVLTLMPLVVLLQKEFDTSGKHKLKINTLFLLSVLWGANIGGIGMVTGTTTNGILLGLYEGFKVPVGRDFTFISWMAWGMPLALILGCVGWLILMLIFQPGKILNKSDFSTKLGAYSLSRRLQKIGFILAVLFIASSSTLSLLLTLFKHHQTRVIALTFVIMMSFVYLMLVHAWKIEGKERQRLLTLKDVFNNIPKKGVIWIAIGALITLVFWKLELHNYFGLWAKELFDGSHNLFLFYIMLALIGTFASEIFSNSGVQITLFMVLFPMIKSNPNITWEGMLIISLCSTCAFMSPIGTPSNGLGFGSSSKVSLKYMLGAGFVMNIASALITTVWIYFVVPFVNKLIIG